MTRTLSLDRYRRRGSAMNTKRKKEHRVLAWMSLGRVRDVAPLLGRDSCCVGLAWGRAEQTVWTHMQVEHWSPVSTNKMLEM